MQFQHGESEHTMSVGCKGKQRLLTRSCSLPVTGNRGKHSLQTDSIGLDRAFRMLGRGGIHSGGQSSSRNTEKKRAAEKLQ